MNYLKGLNPRQAQAVSHGDGPMMIVAGAGSGKTRTLTTRIASLLEQGVHPLSILAITFTNKAADEMRDRIGRLVGDQLVGITRDEQGAVVRTRYNSMWVQTFHAVCVRMLRYDAPRLQYTKSFSIYDTADSLGAIKRCIDATNHKNKGVTAKEARAQISAAKNEMMDFEQYRAMAETPYEMIIADIFEAYEHRLFNANAMDFDDLLVKTVQILQLFPDVLQRYRNKFSHVLVDEWQDTNIVQYEMIRLLCEPNRNLCVVGDGDQSIYAFRGADKRNITKFNTDFIGTTTIVLDQNYRSTDVILQAANAVIQNNPDRQEKNLWTEKQSNDLITLYQAESSDNEANYVLETIKEHLDNGAKPQDIVVLYRTNAQSRAFEEAAIQAGIPYQIIGGIQFYSRKEVKDLLAYLILLLNPHDENSLLRIINVPKRGIGKKTIDTLQHIATSQQCSVVEACKHAVNQRMFAARTHNALQDFLGLMEQLAKLSLGVVTTQRASEPLIDPSMFGVPKEQHQQLSLLELAPEPTKQPAPTQLEGYVQENSFDNLGELIHTVLKLTGLISALENSNDPDAESRIANMLEVASSAHHFASEYMDGEEPTEVLRAFLEQMALVSQQDGVDDSAQRITLMTLHSVKGLEYPIVFLTGMEEGILPHNNAFNTIDGVEEERRLAYVGITRAEDKLYMTYCEQRFLFGRSESNLPSRFLEEIPEQYIEFIAENHTFFDGVDTDSEPFFDDLPYEERRAATKKWYSSKKTASTRSTYQPKLPSSPGYKPTVTSSSRYSSKNTVASATSATSGATNSTGKQPTQKPLNVGDQVKHALFGIGTVSEVIKEKRTDYLIDFGSHGTKRIMGTFAQLIAITD